MVLFSVNSAASDFHWPMFLPAINSTIKTVISAGQVWMDRNLGASQVATSPTDHAAFGDYYQWGRLNDGHEIATSETTFTLSATDVPGHNKFIVVDLVTSFDWRTPPNNKLWQGASGPNNPCPKGFRIPTIDEWEIERASWTSNNAAGAFNSPLKLVMAGYREYDGVFIGTRDGFYWSSTVNGAYSRGIGFDDNIAQRYSALRSIGFTIRCIKD